MSQIFLCFFGDGPLWDNLLLLPAYPSGYSYFRPFRYQNRHIQPSLLSEITDENKRKDLIDSNVVLCMRFKDEENRWKILPLRKATITHVEHVFDNQSVYFKLGPIFDLGGIESLYQACIEVDGDKKSVVGDSLFFCSDIVVNEPRSLTEDEETTMWVRFSDLLAKEATLPVKSEAQSGVFLRFKTPGRKKPAPIGLIHESEYEGKIYGPILSEGTSCELLLIHRIPTLFKAFTSIMGIPFEYKSSGGSVELDRSEEGFTGNFQNHVLSMTALKPTGTKAEIYVSPKQESAESQDGRKINAVQLVIRLKVKRSLLYRFKTIYVWIALLWLALFLSVVIGQLLEGKTNITLIIASGVVSLVSAVMVFVLQQRGGSNYSG